MGKLSAAGGNGSPMAAERNLLGIPGLALGSIASIYKWTLASLREPANWGRSVPPSAASSSSSVERSEVPPGCVAVRIPGGSRWEFVFPARPMAGAGSTR